ncbi:DUF4192 family protein [Nocardia amamiensis]|uniref:DUF4192 family protein n=1 Tax=Nocardia amamiensis TaxID=404578 RepID=UPI00083220CC|nr:DUF4192 family protein [Nocardia amamiensis]
MTTTLERLTTGDLIAAIPAMLRYYPENCLCLIFTKHGHIDTVIPAAIDQDRAGFAAHIARVAHDHQMETARIVVLAHPARTSAGLAFADIVRDHLEAHAIPVLSRAHTWHITPGAMWTDLDNQGGGTIPDPDTSAAAVAVVARGHRILEARADIAARYIPTTTPDFITRRTAAIHSNRPGFAAAVLRELADRIAVNGYPGPGLAARVSILATVDPAARDALLGVGLIDLDAAASIYIDIANQLRALPRAHLLAAAATLYYVTGQGVASYEAISHAQTAARAARAENLSLINFVTTAHARAFRPDLIRRFLAAGQIAAEKFGIAVPDYTG